MFIGTDLMLVELNTSQRQSEENSLTTDLCVAMTIIVLVVIITVCNYNLQTIYILFYKIFH